MFCSPDLIKVSPDFPRYRMVDINHPDVKAMADSIEEVGQLQPILVDQNMTLTDGLHRLMACKRLERDVWVATEEQGKLILDNPYLRRAAEYQANFRRKDFTPDQTSAAIADIHNLMVQVYGNKQPGNPLSEGWTQADTARKLGHKSHRIVSEALAIDKAMKTGAVPGIEKATTMQEASKMVKDAIRLRASEEMARRQSKYGPTTDIGNPLEWFGSKVILGDCLDKIKGLDHSICSMFITDPPFGIELDKVIEGRGETVSKTRGVYSDREDAILSLIQKLIPEIARVGKPACQVIMFCGVQFWHIIRDWFQDAGFSVHKKPLIWLKASTDPFHMTSGRTSNPSFLPGSSYEAMVYAYRGGATMAMQGLPDVFVHQTLPGGEKCHVAQKPIPLLEEIISRFYHPGTNPLLIDPFAGSGSTLVAARRLGIKQYFGYELSPENRERAVAYMVNQYVKEQEGKNQPTIMDEEFE